MSLKRNLKTYLIAAVILLMGGLAVGTVATAKQPSSYLGIRKVWEFKTPEGEGFDWDAWSNAAKDLTIVLEVSYYNLDQYGNPTGDLVTDKVYMDSGAAGYPGSLEWFKQKHTDGLIRVESVKEVTGGAVQGGVTIPGIENIGDYVLFDTDVEWKEGKEIYHCGDSIYIGYGMSDILILEKEDIADGEEYSYSVESDMEGVKESVVTLTKEHPRQLVQVSGIENSYVCYTVNEGGGGEITLEVKGKDIPRSVIETQGVYMEYGSDITIHAPEDSGKKYTFELYYQGSDGERYCDSRTIESGGTGRMEASQADGVYVVRLTKVEDTVAPVSEIQLQSEEPENEPTEGSGNTGESESGETGTGTEDGKTTPEEADNTGNTEDLSGSSAGNETGSTDGTEIKDEGTPLTNGEAVDADEDSAGNEQESPDVPGDTANDISGNVTDGGSTDTSEDTGDGEEQAENPGNSEGVQESVDNPDAEIMPLDAGADDPLEGYAFTVDYSYKASGVSVEDIRVVNSAYTNITVSAESNGSSEKNAWPYKVLRRNEGEESYTEIGTITVGAEQSLAEAMEGIGGAADGVYSLQAAGDCTITYYNPGVVITNTYKKLGAYNVVHEYYVNEVLPENYEGRSVITLEKGALDEVVTAEGVDHQTEFEKRQYEYVSAAYGIGERKPDFAEEATPGDDENADEGIAANSETSGDAEVDSKEQNGVQWKPVDDYQEEADKANAVVKKDGDEVVILKYVRTTDPDDPEDPPKDPEDPKDPPKDPETPPDLPDPNDPESPPTITITDDDVPRTYVRVWDSEKEEWVYLPEDEVPLAGRTSAKTADGMAPVFWMFMAGLSVAGVGVFRYNKKKKEE